MIKGIVDKLTSSGKSNNSSEGLTELIHKISSTGFLFLDIVTDMKSFSDMKGAENRLMNAPLLHMEYAYVRRISASALYLQGLIDWSSYDYIQSIFKSTQQITGHTVEFQEEAFKGAVKFCSSYNVNLNALLLKSIVMMAIEHESDGVKISDRELVIKCHKFLSNNSPS